MTVLFADLWACARATWSQFDVSHEAFVGHLTTLLDEDPDLADLRAADLYLALACLRGDPAALAAFEDLLVPVRAALVRAYRDQALVDDALQTVRYRVLVATPEREAKLATYRGRGSLAGWLRVVAMRQVRELARGRVATDDDALADAIADRDPVIDILARAHGAAIRHMFREAVAALDAKQRHLLRLEILDGVPHQRIAELHAVHRTTALRWLDDVRATLACDVRRRVKAELALGDDSAESLLRVLRSRIELSLASGLLAA
jgi:RNA polymerase sigma-70 factor (ECF subfamily)